MVDALGNPLRGVLDYRRVADLLPAAESADNVLADKAYDMDTVLANMTAMGPGP